MTIQQYIIVFFGQLFLLLFGLKIANAGLVAAWSWWLVFSPIYIFFGGFAFLFLLGYVLAKITNKPKKDKREILKG